MQACLQKCQLGPYYLAKLYQGTCIQEVFTHLIASAGSTVNATQEVCAIVAAFAPEAEAKQLQSDITAGSSHSQQSSVCSMMHCLPAQSLV